MNHCNAHAGKKEFSNLHAALRALSAIRYAKNADKTAGKMPVRAYRCPSCRKYLLTSQPKRRTHYRRS